MLPQRLSENVVQELLDEMFRIVTNYHQSVRLTGRRVEDLIDGTAVFPGGSGLWRGDLCHGPLPQYFPESPVMFVAHNFDSAVAHDRSKNRGGEVESSFFWKVLIEILREAGVRPERCFFTNALMCLQPKSAVGSMPTAPGYEEQCGEFLRRQFEIVGPRAIIALGGKARARVSKAGGELSWIHIMHPSAREFRPLQTRSERIKVQAAAIREFLVSLNGEHPTIEP